jgi:gas vesicle protein GvpL/GvpF
VSEALADTAGPMRQTVRAGPLYVYGFVGSGALKAPREEGVGQKPVSVVEGDGVAALVSPVAGADVRLRRRDLTAHLRVIEAAFASTTILPCPFGTVVPSVEELERDVLGAARDELLAGLTQLEGTVQMNVKAIYDEEALLREIVGTDGEIALLRERTRGAGDAGYAERVRLGELTAARIAERAELDGERLVRALAANAVDVAVEQPAAGAALRASFLVERAALDRFDAALEALARDEQPLLRFDAIGPLPPTAFAAAYAAG